MNPEEVKRRLAILTRRFPNADKDWLFSHVENDALFPAVTEARPDALDPSIHPTPPVEPVAKVGLPLAKLYASMAAGGGAGGLTAKVLGPLARGILSRSLVGAASGVAGGAAARGTGAALQGENPLKAFVGSPLSVGIDAAVGGAASNISPALAWAKKALGFTPKATTAQHTSETMQEIARRLGKKPEDVADMIRKAQGRPISVSEVDPQFRALGNSAALTSPVAERELQAFANQRFSVPAKGALADVEQAVGAKAANVKTTASRMKDAIAKNDNKRFNPLWKKFKDPLTDPEFLKQWDPIHAQSKAAIAGMKAEQKLLQQPVQDLLQKGIIPGKTRATDIPTIKGLHRMKTSMDRAIRAGEKATQNGTISADQAMHLGVLKTARGQLLDALAKSNMPGSKEYLDALAASRAERDIRDALIEGYKAMKAGVTPKDVSQKLTELTTKPKGPSVVNAYKRGALGSIASRVGAARTTNPAILDELARAENTTRKLASMGAGPDLTDKLVDRLAVAETNMAQGRIQPPHYPGAQAEGQAAGFGAAGAIGNLLTGDVRGAKRGLELVQGSKIAKAFTGRKRAAIEKSFEEMAPWLRSAPGKQSADQYMEMVRKYDLIKRARSARGSLYGGILSGAQPRPYDQQEDQP